MNNLALINAVKANNLDEVRDIILNEVNTGKIDIDLIDHTEKTALYYAVENRNYDIIRELLNSSSDITLIDEIFEVVFENDDAEAYGMLLDRDSLNTLLYHDSDNETIIYCIENNKVGILDVLLTRYPHLVDQIIDEIKPPLMYAAEVNASLDVGKVLLKHGADPNALDEDHQHILTVGDLEWIKFLVENGSDVNFRSFGNNTPLHELIFHGDTIVDYLLDQGADPTKRNNQGTTPLHLGISSIPAKILDRILDEYGVDFLDGLDEEHQTVLHHLVSVDFVPTNWDVYLNWITSKLRVLFLHQANFQVLNSDGYNPVEFVEDRFEINAFANPWTSNMKDELIRVLKELTDPSLFLLSRRTIIKSHIDVSSLPSVFLVW